MAGNRLEGSRPRADEKPGQGSVAHHPLNGVALHIPVAAEDLNRVDGYCRGGLSGCQQCGTDRVLAHNPTVDLLRRLLDRFGTGLAYVLVRNQVRGSDFGTLEQSGEQARAIRMGAHVVSMKKLNEGAMQKIDNTSSSFWKAKTSDRDASGLGLMDRQRVKMWLRDVYREIDEVGV